MNNSGLIESLSGTLDITGAITQSATDRLRINGATIQLSGFPALQGNLSGTGTFQVATLNHSNGAIAPGLSAGTLAFTDNLNLASTSILNFELGTLSD